MLDGAIAGSVFTSPPVDDVLSAIMTLAGKKNSLETLPRRYSGFHAKGAFINNVRTGGRGLAYL